MEILYALLACVLGHSVAASKHNPAAEQGTAMADTVYTRANNNHHRRSMKSEHLLSQLNHYQLAVPALVDHRGNFLSYYNHSPRRRKKRSTHGESNHNTRDQKWIFYKLSAYGIDFHFNLTLNQGLVPRNYIVEYWDGDRVKIKTSRLQNCHYFGFISSSSSSRVALSNCYGLHGVFATDKEEYFVEPLWNDTRNEQTEGRLHVVYKRSAIKIKHATESCGVQDQTNNIPHWWYRLLPWKANEILKPHHYGYHHKDKWRSRRRRTKRSISKERHVETLVVVDRSMVEYHGKEEIEPYVLTVMNIDGLRINHHADRSLESFCRWQNSIRHKVGSTTGILDKGIPHHDNAVLITRYDICTYKNAPCGTLGLAPVAGMCEADRSCSINEDNGLASAFTIAHEIGHNSGRGKCLENAPSDRHFKYPKNMPGQTRDANKQCKLQYGQASYQCKYGEVCRELWCIGKHGRCVTNSIPAAEGTTCITRNKKKGWCYSGHCLRYGWRPRKQDGQWGRWSSWGSCSRTCGGGVESSERYCHNPKPSHGGKYCIGERKQYRSCNTFDCPLNSTNFRAVQCEKFNDIAFRGKLYKWKPFTGELGDASKAVSNGTGQINPCALNCLAEGYNFYTERAPKVIDGTRCHPDSVNMCINGECRHVGCDRILGSSAVEDKCRVCGGDGSTCETISGVFAKRLKSGSDSYQEVVTIPQGAVYIKVQEMEISKNYLAVKSVDNKYYINGDWTIDWPRQFKIADTIFHYERPKTAIEALHAVGPTSEDLVIMLLLQEENKGIKFQYNMPVYNDTYNGTQFVWQYTPWSQCSSSCAKGFSKATAVCVRKEDRTTQQEKHCVPHLRPKDKIRYCNDFPCPPEWQLGSWTSCTRTCGGGVKTRTVDCARQIDQTRREVLHHRACGKNRPRNRLPCSRNSCPPRWETDEWSRCYPQCGPGWKSRNVYCVNSQSRYMHPRNCKGLKKPPNRLKCDAVKCPPPSWDFGAWGECSAKCGKGQHRRSVQCRTYKGEPSDKCDPRRKPRDIEECEGSCIEAGPEECKDVNKVAYCPLVLKFKFCNRSYFRKMCCKTCREHSGG